MRIQNIQNQNFGKQAVMTCKVVDSNTKRKTPATLWKYTSINYKDQREIRENDAIPDGVKETFMRYYDFGAPNAYFYVLKNGDNGETISYAQTSNHYRESDSEINGLYTKIDEYNTNPNYLNAMEPIIAQIVNEAEDRGSSSVAVSVGEDDVPMLKNIKFNKTKYGEYYIPEKRFESIIDKAQQRSQIKFWA